MGNCLVSLLLGVNEIEEIAILMSVMVKWKPFNVSTYIFPQIPNLKKVV